MSPEWPPTIEGLDYYPVPADWVERWSDRHEGDVRLSAVSATLYWAGRR